MNGAMTADAFMDSEALLHHGSDDVVIVTDLFSIVLSPFVPSSGTTDILVSECVQPSVNVSHHCCINLTRDICSL